MITDNPDQRIQTTCLMMLTTIAVGFVLWALKPVFIPFILAIFFVFCLSPVIDFQMRYLRIRKTLAVIISAIFGVLILALIWAYLAGVVGQLTANADAYKDQLSAFFHQAVQALPLETIGVDADTLNQRLLETAGGVVTHTLRETLNGIMGILSNGLLVIIFMVFMMFGKTTGSERRISLFAKVEPSIKKYVLALLAMSGLTGTLVGATLWLIGVKFSWLFGFLAFLLNFIPSIGSIIATLLPVPVILISPDLSVMAKIFAIFIPAGIQFTIGNFIQPKLMGSSLDLHPVVVLMALIFFGMIWGIVGMFLATPITAVVKIILEQAEYTRPAAALLAGRLEVLDRK